MGLFSYLFGSETPVSKRRTNHTPSMYDYPSHYDHGYEDGFDDCCYDGCCHDDSCQGYDFDDEYDCFDENDCFDEYIYCNNFDNEDCDEYDENDGDW